LARIRARAKRGQGHGVVLSADERLHHRPARDTEDVGGHGGELDQRVFQELFDALLDAGTVGDQIEPHPGPLPDPPDRLRGHERGREHAALAQLGQPHRVDLVALWPPRGVFDLAGARQPHLKAASLQQVVKRAPVVRSRLQHHPLDALTGKVIGQLADRRGSRVHLPYLGHPLARDPVVGHRGAHHLADLGHIDGGDPLRAVLGLLDLGLDRLLHGVLPGVA
jgi:hypothetical protein